MYLRTTQAWRSLIFWSHSTVGNTVKRCQISRIPALPMVQCCSQRTIFKSFSSTSSSWKQDTVKWQEPPSSSNRQKADEEYVSAAVPRRFGDVSGLFAHVHNVVLRAGASASAPRLSAAHSRSGWQCRLEVSWPEPAQHVATARSKRDAARRVKADAIRQLQQRGLLLENGDPVLTTPQTSEPVPEVALPSRFSSVGSLYQHVQRVVLRDAPGAGAPSLSVSHSTHAGWEARLKVSWPEPVHYVSRARGKRDAATHVKAQMLRSLQERGLLSPSGDPVIFTREGLKERLAALRRTPELAAPPDRLLTQADRLYRRLQEVRQSLEAQQQAAEEAQADGHRPHTDTPQQLSRGLVSLFGGPDEWWPPVRLQQRSERLKRQLERWHRLAAEPGSAEADIERAQCALPVHKWSSEIVSAVARHPVVIVRGETGSGKSTQVPRLLLEAATAEGRGAHCNVLVTQPRRLAAVSLARRVAQIHGEELRDAIGYQVRLDSQLPRERGGVLFCTMGVVLAQLQENLSLSGVSHLVIDEVHERSVETDVLLLLVRRLLHQHPQLRVVLMSASVDAALFSRYFDHAPIIDVPGRVFPVRQYLLEDVSRRLSVPSDALAELQRRDRLERPAAAAEPVARVVAALCRQRPPGAVLVFLEGIAEIRQVEERLRALLPDRATHWLLPVSGRLTSAQQQRIFGRPPDGVRKVVLATNVAETGITVDDVVYVVDTGAVKQTRLEPESGLSCLRTEWISQASAAQRQGRAGRVQPGEIYRLYSGERLRQMERYDTPELLRAPLETVVLSAKHLCADVPAEQFLASALEPPPAAAVSAALQQLTTLQMLEPETERLTALGRLSAHLQIHPRHVRLLVYGIMLRCVEPTLTLTGWEACGREPYAVSLDSRPQLLEVKRRVGGTSDQRAAVLLQRGFRRHPEPRQYCHNNMLAPNGMVSVQSLMRMLGSQLEQSGLVERREPQCDVDADNDDVEEVRARGRWSGRGNSDDLLSADHPLNRRANHWPLVTGALIAGPMRNVARVQRGAILKGRLRPNTTLVLCSEGRADPTGDSVNRRPDSSCRPFLVYGSAFFSGQRSRHVLRDTTQASALQVALFYGDRHQARELDEDPDGERQMLRLSCDGQYPLHVLGPASAVRCVQQLREVLQFTVWQQLEAAAAASCAGRTASPLLCPAEVTQLHDEAVSLIAELLQAEQTD